MPSPSDSSGSAELSRELPWLDRPDAESLIAARLAAGDITALEAEHLGSFTRDGFVDLGVIIEAELCDRVRAETEAVIAAHEGQPMTAWMEKLQSRFTMDPASREAVIHPAVLRYADLILEGRSHPFQTLSAPCGSQIPGHSDEILMTTDPRGYMVAAWWALEDVGADVGPLQVWPGSHRLPYLGSKELGVAPEDDEEARKRLHNERYYKMIAERTADIEPRPYLAKKGQVLLWHSNLVHGGQPIQRVGSTRHSLVVHYYPEGRASYSDLFDRANPCPPDIRPADR